MRIKSLWIIIFSVAIFIVLLFILKPSFQPSNQQDQSVVDKTSPPVPSVTPTPAAKTFELVIKGKKIVSGLSTIKVTQGEEIVIKITADEPEEFHVHAYDNSVELEKDKQGELGFTANLTGRFPFELERSKTDLGVIEVLPK